MFGTHYPLRLQMEEQILTQLQRAHPYSNSSLGLQTLNNDDESFGFQDWFSYQRETTDHQPDIHSIMERRYGI